MTMNPKEFQYQSGFANEFATEAVTAALPVVGNNPQKAPHGLYAEQISGTAFTVPQVENRRSWLYRIRPSVCHQPFECVAGQKFKTQVTPNQLRWDPLPIPDEPTNFIDGIRTICVTGDIIQRTGSAVHVYLANKSMEDEFYYNADGDYLLVPQHGGLVLKTELGNLSVNPLEIAVIPRGIKFQVVLNNKTARGYICENYGPPFRLPDRGPIGANGLANPRDFLTPVAAYEERTGDFKLIAKFGGQIWAAAIDHSPLNVVAWHGNYAPYKYDLKRFNVINTVSFDHPDPSIFTVLTSPSGYPGTANVDFVIFPPRWLVAENTFRPPYYHRNVMSEYMGLIVGLYDAKEGGDGGFVPGGASLHNCMSAHGPDAATFEKAATADLKPVYVKDTMAFMFESRTVYKPTEFALTTKALQKNYQDCWRGLKANFTPLAAQHVTMQTKES